jgi:hypothetical protein
VSPDVYLHGTWLAFYGLGGLFWLAMLIWCVLKDPEERHIWLFVIFFLNVVGAALYFTVRVLPRLGLYDRLVLAGRRRREIERVEAELIHLDRPHLWARLGELRLENGELEAADEAIQRALSRDDDTDYRYTLGRVARARGDLAMAATELEKVVAKKPDHAYGEAKRLLARTYLEAARADEARRLYEELVKSYPSAEVRYHFALLLDRAGDREHAREQLDRVALEARALPEFGRRNQREWIAKARSLRREL